MSDFRSFVPRHRFQRTVAVSPDGKRIAYACNVSGQYNLWVAEVDGAARRLTDYTDDAVRDVAWAPDGATVAFTVDHHGNEQTQVHLVSPDGGPSRALTEVSDRQFQLADSPFAPDGTTFVYTGNDRDERCHDLLLRDLSTGEVRRVESEPGLWAAGSVSPDGRWLLALRINGNTDGDVYVLDLHDPDAQPVAVTAHAGEEAHWGGPWASDSTSFYDRTDAGGEFYALRLVDARDGSSTVVAEPEADIELVRASRDGSTLAWSVNNGGISRLVVVRDGAEVPLPDVPGGTIHALDLSADGSRLALVLATATRPSDLALVDLDAGTFGYLTDSRPPALLAGEPVRPRLVEYPTHDGRHVPAWLYVPRGEGPFPFVVSVHGGPEAQERPDYAYSGLYQQLLVHGVGVLAPNIRGSVGYGKTYQKLIHRDWGGAELGDLEHAALYLRGRDDVDPDRIAVYGGSFGGFAVLSCLSRLPQYWAAGVSVVGPSNLVTMARSVPPSWRPLMAKWMGDPDDDAEMLIERSPITHADNIVAPLMVVQGANDPRVVKAESDQIVERLRARGVEVRYDVYDDEGHGFTNRTNEITALADIGEFLVGHLTS